jgi:hypothetical protein
LQTQLGLSRPAIGFDRAAIGLSSRGFKQGIDIGNANWVGHGLNPAIARYFIMR